ncbi:asparaginase [Candidatus Parcubacteria bacterium]|nr:asparaginase [Candidatus Parcubacteria bacterium]
MKKKILVIGTGGTIASIKTKKGLRSAYKTEELLSFFPEADKIAEVKGMELFNLDSTNIQPQHWSEMAKEIEKRYDEYDGFVITHGTDTMHYTAATLSLMLQNLNKPVILTGSVKAIGKDSDAKQNFLDSILVAVSDINEVCIVFHGKIIKGSRAKKVTNEATKIAENGMGVFTSINCHLVGEFIGKVEGIYERKIVLNKKHKSVNCQNKKRLKILTEFDSNIVFLKIYPGFDSEILDKFTNSCCVILEAFGPGNLPFSGNSILEKIKKLNDSSVPVFITTQNPFGEVDMNLYEVGIKAMEAGAVSCKDMTSEAVIVKAMWLLGNFKKDANKIKKLMLKNFVGEIRE